MTFDDAVTELVECAGYIHEALLAEVRQREDDDDMAWIGRERVAVANAAHEWASANDLTCTVTAADVEQVEVSALGHVDYAEKLSLAVAELVMEWADSPGDEGGEP